MQTTPLILALLAGLAVSGAAQAALIDRGGGLLYDDVLNITWLQDANYAKTSGYDADGLMTWADAMTWAANLSYYDSVRNVTYDDWRLPTTLQPDLSCGNQMTHSSGDVSYGYNCTGSELGHLFYNELGGVAGQSIALAHDADYNLFSNVQTDYYWSATEYAPNTYYAWVFNTSGGSQSAGGKPGSAYAWAVHTGDVVAAPIPEADTYALMLVGLGLVGWMARRRR